MKQALCVQDGSHPGLPSIARHSVPDAQPNLVRLGTVVDVHSTVWTRLHDDIVTHAATAPGIRTLLVMWCVACALCVRSTVA